MTIQRVLHLNQNVSLHHRLSSSPFLFMFFFFFFFFLFFWDSCKGGFCLFDQKKRKKEREAFFCVSRPSLFSSPFRRLWKRQKKKRALFFLLLSDANKRTNANASLRLKSTTGGRVQKDDARLKKVLFLFCCVVLCSCFLIRMLFRFERRERKGNHQKSPKKGKKKFSRSKKFGFLFFFFFFLFQKRAAKERRGLQNKFWIVSKTFIAQL